MLLYLQPEELAHQRVRQRQAIKHTHDLTAYRAGMAHHQDFYFDKKS